MSTALTLAEIATGGSVNANPAEMAVIRQFLTHDQFTGLLRAVSIPGTDFKYRRELTEPTATIYAVDGTITDTAAKYTTVTDQTGRILVNAQLDDKVVIHGDLTSAWTEQLMSAGWKIGSTWANQVVNGTGANDANISGILDLLDDIGATAKYAASSTTTGGNISFAKIDAMLEIPKYPVDFMMCHTKILNNLLVDFRALGGVPISEVKVPIAAISNGNLVIDSKPVVSYRGIPIFVNDYMGTETTYGGSGKYRMVCGSLNEAFGLHAFYPQATSVGVTIEPLHMVEDKDEKFLRVRHQMGLALKSTKSIAQLVNLAYTAP